MDTEELSIDGHICDFLHGTPWLQDPVMRHHSFSFSLNKCEVRSA